MSFTIKNYTYGTLLESTDFDESKILIPKNVAYFSYNLTTLQFKLEGKYIVQNFYSAKFLRTDIAAIFDNDVVVAIPGTDDLLFHLLSSYFTQPVQINTTVFLNPTPALVVTALVGNAYGPVQGDNGKHFIWDVPAAAKTLTLPPGLSLGWYCYVVKKYAGNNITIAPGPGVTLQGIDVILNNQYAIAKIVSEGVNLFGIYNLGG